MTSPPDTVRLEAMRGGEHRHYRVPSLLEMLAVLILALGVRLGALHHPHFHDELYHVLAAKSLLANGTLVIGAGDPYTRASGFTYLVAGVFKLAGVGMTQLRIVPLAAGTLTVGLLFGWLHRAVGRATAWIAAVLLILDPESVIYSATGRFYSLQTLLFLVAVVCAWWSTLPGRATRSQFVGLAGAAVALGATIHLQVSSLLGAVLLALWVVIVLATKPITRATIARRRLWVAATSVVFVGLIIMAWLAGTAGWLARMSEFVPAWAAAQQHEIRFYYWAMFLDYPLLVALLPVLAVLAIGRWPREATLCLLIPVGV
ncbi:MAG: hypothetical protein ABIT38_17635, partial [Gemmatimonadaceae bacterium]